MNRVPLIDRNATTADRKALLDPIHAAFGTTPNMFRAVANSPAALKSMWSAFGALGGGVIASKLGEQIAVAVADRKIQSIQIGTPTVDSRRVYLADGIRTVIDVIIVVDEIEATPPAAMPLAA